MQFDVPAHVDMWGFVFQHWCMLIGAQFPAVGLLGDQGPTFLSLAWSPRLYGKVGDSKYNNLYDPRMVQLGTFTLP